MTDTRKFTCLLCGSDVEVASKRRLIYLVTKANAEAHNFFVQFVFRGYVFSPVHSPKYLCRSPCFSNLEKALKHNKALEKILASLRSQLASRSQEQPERADMVPERREDACRVESHTVSDVRGSSGMYDTKRVRLFATWS